MHFHVGTFDYLPGHFRKNIDIHEKIAMKSVDRYSKSMIGTPTKYRGILKSHSILHEDFYETVLGKTYEELPVILGVQLLQKCYNA